MKGKHELVGEYKCPVCTLRELLASLIEGLESYGIPEPFTKAMTDIVKAQGWMRPEVNFYPQLWEGAVYDQEWLSKIPDGSELPAFHIYVSVCPKCGCIYTSKLETSIAIRRAGKPMPPKIILPYTELPDGMKRVLEGIDFSKLDKGVT